MVVPYILKYGVAAPLYTAFRWLIPILVIYGLPIFIAGMLVAILGTMGHIFFLILFTVALLYYFRYVYKIFNPSTTKKPSTSQHKKKTLKSTKSFDTSLGYGRYGRGYDRYGRRY